MSMGPDKLPESAALPQTEALPAPHRRFDQVCAPGYQGRKRGEVVRTRTVIRAARIRISFSVRLAERASGITAGSCDKRSG
jgi:hypothetical protein